MPLPPGRRKLYDQLQRSIGNTPLGRIDEIPVPNGNRIFFKEEYRNPTGSHYDRQFVRLLRALEATKEIMPGETSLIEATTGNAGASFAWLCRILGYKCRVVIPRDMPGARIAQIRSFGARITYSPGGKYVKGVIDKLRTELKSKKERCANHAADEVHCIEAMRELGREILRDLNRKGIRNVDYFVVALGNGSSARGVGSVLAEERGTKIVGVEPFECPTYFLMRFGIDEFRKRYGEEPRCGPHSLLGTGAWDTEFQFVNASKMLPKLEDIILVKQEEWEHRMKQLADAELQLVGRTSAACLHAALELAEAVSDKTFVVIFYDPAWKYLGTK